MMMRTTAAAADGVAAVAAHVAKTLLRTIAAGDRWERCSVCCDRDCCTKTPADTGPAWTLPVWVMVGGNVEKKRLWSVMRRKSNKPPCTAAAHDGTNCSGCTAAVRSTSRPSRPTANAVAVRPSRTGGGVCATASRRTGWPTRRRRTRTRRTNGWRTPAAACGRLSAVSPAAHWAVRTDSSSPARSTPWAVCTGVRHRRSGQTPAVDGEHENELITLIIGWSVDIKCTNR